MYMNKFLKIAAISTLAFTLAACSSKSNNYPGYKGEPAATKSTKAQTYALGQKKGLTGSDMNGGVNGTRHVNSMSAPSHQVYYFSYDQSQMSSDDVRAATVQANYLSTHKNAKIRLEGNADDRGSREYNIGLGWRRAQTVARVLKQQGVSPRQIQMVSYGKEHPAVSGDNEEAYRLNRRVELIYVQE